MPMEIILNKNVCVFDLKKKSVLKLLYRTVCVLISKF